jgi:hypothetical protein
MGNEPKIEENNNRLNEDEIIENDCYEEINLKKINKIIEDEKNWNKNSIIYTIKDKEFLDIEEEIKANDIQNKSEKDKEDIQFFKKKTEKKPIKDISEKDEEIPPNEEEKNTNNNIPENKDNGEKEKEEIKENQENMEIKENKEDKENKENKENKVNKEKKEDKINNKINEDEKVRSNLSYSNCKSKIKPTNTGNGIIENSRRKSQSKISNTDIIRNSLTNSNLNNIERYSRKNVNDFLDIKNIVPEYRLNHLKDNEIIYSGTLEKILKIPEKNKIAYSQRFCILTKNYFAYYKSKESYISLNKPMLLLNNNYILRIENTCFTDNTYYFGIICEVNNETKKYIEKVNSFVTKEDNVTELLLGFRTKEYEDMIKWVVVLTYFTSGKNKGN